jgi:hypothetical protein
MKQSVGLRGQILKLKRTEGIRGQTVLIRVTLFTLKTENPHGMPWVSTPTSKVGGWPKTRQARNLKLAGARRPQRAYTRWFKYDRDRLCVNKSQFVPVIFEPPCIFEVGRRHLKETER